MTDRPGAGPAVEPGQIVETEIERIVPGGMGLAHAAGLTLFVALSAPGDLARVRVDRVQGRVGFGSVVALARSGPSRVTAPCPHFGICGGCDWQHLGHEAQLGAKQEIIRDCLLRIGGIELAEPPRMIPSPEQWAYRARAVWRYDCGHNALGYYELGSHRVRDVDSCAVLVPALQTELHRVRRLAAIGQMPRGADRLSVATAGEAVVSEPRLEREHRDLCCTVAGEHYWFDPACFFQTNLGLLNDLVRETLHSAPEPGAPGRASDWALDLYCGVGLFTVPLARRFPRVTGVEANRQAANLARRNLAAAGLGQAQVVAAEAGRWLAATRGTMPPPALAVVDPPRAGIAPAALAALAAWQPPRIAYVSCDPATLARDLRQLLGQGYALRSVVGLDMFPQTHHVETVAELELTG